MKKIFLITILIVAVIALLLFKINTQSKEISLLTEKNIAVTNIFLNECKKTYKLTIDIDEIKQYNDKLIHQMDSVKEQLKIKDKTIQSMYARRGVFIKTDTIYIDTFRAPEMFIDTLITDGKWYSLFFEMQYPNYVIVKPSFKTQLTLVKHSDKVYVKPKRKFPLFRLFQKKQTVTVVEAIEDNPYIESEENRFVEIIK